MTMLSKAPQILHAIPYLAQPATSNQQSSDYAITPNQSIHNLVYHEPTIMQLATASSQHPYIPLHGQRLYIV
jgi:hypothetical protein